jgi:cytidylate kinase
LGACGAPARDDGTPPFREATVPVILISRGTMSGATLLVQRLAECTGFRCVAREDLVALANRRGELAHQIVERLGDPAQGYEELCELRRPYVILMRAALLELAASDDLIYHGYSGHLLLPPISHFVRIRINAPAALRIRMTMERLRCTEAEAKAHIARDDEQRVRWARFLYGQDIRDPSHYDLCVNLERLSIVTSTNVLCALKDDEACQATAESAAAVERLLLETRVEAALASDERTADIELSAQAAGGCVSITGQYLDDVRRSAVLAIAAGVAGVTEAQYRYGFAPAFGVRS